MHKATPATWGGLFARFTSWEFSTCRIAYWTSLAIPQTILGWPALVGKSLSPGTALALGWGSIGSTPLKEPLGTGAGKCYLVFDPILVEDELSLGIGYLKLFDT